MLLTLLAIAVGFTGGAAAALYTLRRRPVRGTVPVLGSGESAALPVATTQLAKAPSANTPSVKNDGAPVEAAPESSPHLVALLGDALRSPLLRLRRASVPSELVEAFERVAWQARMLTSRARPLQAQPSSPISLLQEAAERVESLRLGKVSASWSLLTRTPVHVDPERALSAFRELLSASAEAAGESGRIAVRIHEGDVDGYPVCVEIAIAQRGAEPDPLAFIVGKRLLEGQGARVSVDGGVTRIDLRSIAPEDSVLSE